MVDETGILYETKSIAVLGNIQYLLQAGLYWYLRIKMSAKCCLIYAIAKTVEGRNVEGREPHVSDAHTIIHQLQTHLRNTRQS